MPEIVSLTLQWLLILSPVGALLYWNSLNPDIQVSDNRRVPGETMLAIVLAFGLLLLAALLGETLIDLLNISEPNWRIAAGVLLIIGAVRLILLRDPFTAQPLVPDGDPWWLATLRLTVWLANPAAFTAAMSFSLYKGTQETLVAIAIGLGVTQLLMLGRLSIERRSGRPVLREIARALLLGTVLVGLRLIIDGVDGI